MCCDVVVCFKLFRVLFGCLMLRVRVSCLSVCWFVVVCVCGVCVVLFCVDLCVVVYIRDYLTCLLFFGSFV